MGGERKNGKREREVPEEKENNGQLSVDHFLEPYKLVVSIFFFFFWGGGEGGEVSIFFSSFIY